MITSILIIIQSNVYKYRNKTNILCPLLQIILTSIVIILEIISIILFTDNNPVYICDDCKEEIYDDDDSCFKCNVGLGFSSYSNIGEIIFLLIVVGIIVGTNKTAFKR